MPHDMDDYLPNIPTIDRILNAIDLPAVCPTGYKAFFSCISSRSLHTFIILLMHDIISMLQKRKLRLKQVR